MKGKDRFYCHYIKRALDLLLAFLLALPATVIVALCYVGIKIESKEPAFFVQERSGYKGKAFKIYKLRTMIVETEFNGHPLSDMERTTKTGRIIRTFSFDELPQNFQIERKADIINIPNITFELLFPAKLISAINLCPAGNARLDVMSTHLL